MSDLLLFILIALVVLIYVMMRNFEKSKLIKTDQDKKTTILAQQMRLLKSIEQILESANYSFTGIDQNDTNTMKSFSKTNGELIFNVWLTDSTNIVSLKNPNVLFHWNTELKRRDIRVQIPWEGGKEMYAVYFFKYYAGDTIQLRPNSTFEVYEKEIRISLEKIFELEEHAIEIYNSLISTGRYKDLKLVPAK